jgi:hypothetical protein
MGAEYTIPRDVEDLKRAITDVCQKYKVPNVASFLATIMSGVDPRNIEPPWMVKVKKIVYREFDEEGGPPYPSHAEWDDLVPDWFSGQYNAYPVDLKTSVDAAKKLMDFVHKNQKMITAQVEAAENREPEDITEEDILRVRKIFNDVF